MQNKGWYSKVICSDNEPQTRWVSFDSYFLCAYSNKKDTIPNLAFHVDNIQITEAFEEIGQMHSIRLNLSHQCSFDHFFIYTPNQFDIVEIKDEIINQQNKWREHCTNDEPDYSQDYVLDVTGKFIFRPADRIHFSLSQTEVKVTQLNQEDIIIPINSNFDIHPSNESPKDVKWIIIKYESDSETKTAQYHCSNLDIMKKLVSTSLQIRNRLQSYT